MKPSLIPRLVPCVWASLKLDPTPGQDIAAAIGQPVEQVFEALIWMEARGYATLRPNYGGYGWVPGRNEMRKAA